MAGEGDEGYLLAFVCAAAGSEGLQAEVSTALTANPNLIVLGSAEADPSPNPNPEPTTPFKVSEASDGRASRLYVIDAKSMAAADRPSSRLR